MKLSVAIISYNEEANIGRTLEAVKNIAEEIIIVDSFSTDKTKEIALTYDKVQFFEESFKGDGPQKVSAIDKCSGEWILLLDADEQLTPELEKHIKGLVFENKATYKVYEILLISVINNKPIKYGGWSNSYKKRLFKKDSGKMKPVKVHSYWMTEEKIGKIHQPINHYLYRDVFHHIDKLNTYTTEQAKVKYANGKRMNLLKVIFVPHLHFFKMYIIRLGFLDGVMGFYLAVVDYFYAFLKYYKQYNLQKNGRT